MTPDAPLDQLRIHAPRDSRPRPDGEFVLYWMQVTLRAHDNFALNFAVVRANELGLPVLVYQELRHDYPWASDRFHTFILESAADLYEGFAAKGMQYALDLDRRRAGRAGSAERSHSALVQLANRSALVVTDYFPTFIVPRQIKALRARVSAPVIAVDSCTVVPLAFHDREHLTARSMRPILDRALSQYLRPVANPIPRRRSPIELPFDPVLPGAVGARRGTPIADLVASCAIDHTVPPARELRGGSRAARARLSQFLERDLPRFDQRNDPNANASSRLSPYLHFGNIGIHEVLLAVREAGPADQAAKFFDEALTWRELAHNFVFRNPRHRTVAAIPEWAAEQLRVHEADPRPALYTDDELEHARTGDELWNACQRAYLVDGWMNNYLRMLWGKAVLQWTPNAGECLRVLEHLNNKYALDGRDPNSYAGIMWTFGKFDRPFYRRPIYGTVRYQSLRAAREKFDVPRYIARYEQLPLGRPVT